MELYYHLTTDSGRTSLELSDFLGKNSKSFHQLGEHPHQDHQQHCEGALRMNKAVC